MYDFENVSIPDNGVSITVESDELKVPNNPIIPFIRGDGIGIDIWPATRLVLDAAVKKAYGGQRHIAWMKIYAGDEAVDHYGENIYLPADTSTAIKTFIVAIKGPLTTPVGGGFRSLNVTLRRMLDLYACVRPVRWYKGVPSPAVHPERMDIVIFRENTEDVYSGIEWQQGTPEVKKVIEFWLEQEMKNKRRKNK